MSLHMLAVLSAVVVAPSAALAQNADGAANQKAEKKICRRVEATGTILGDKRVCHTAAEWKAVDEQNARNAENARRRQVGSPPRG